MRARRLIGAAIGVLAVLVATLTIGVAPSSATVDPVGTPTTTIDCGSLSGDFFTSMRVTAGWTSLTPGASYSLQVWSWGDLGYHIVTVPLTADLQGGLAFDSLLTGQFVSAGSNLVALFSGTTLLNFTDVTANGCPPAATTPSADLTDSVDCATAFTVDQHSAVEYGRQYLRGTISGLTPGLQYRVSALTSSSALPADSSGRVKVDRTQTRGSDPLVANGSTAWSVYAVSDARAFASGFVTVTADCPALIPAPRTRVTHDYDVSGDGHADLLAIDWSGVLRYYPNNSSTNAGHLPFSGVIRAGSGWSSAALPTVGIGDLNGDGLADLLATDSTGRLLYYQNNIRTNANHLPYSRAVVLGSGWKGFVYARAGDLNGDGYADILARRGDGEILYYPSAAMTHKGAPYFPTRIDLGTDFHVDPALGDVNGDGYADKVMMDGFTSIAPNALPAGNAKLFDLSFAPWSYTDNIVTGNPGIAVGDFEGRGRDGLMGVNTAGRLVYVKDPFTPAGAVTSQVVGSGWQSIRQIIG